MKLGSQTTDILRKINTHGMIVLHSFLVPHPYFAKEYENSSDILKMSYREWQLCEQELWSYQTDTKTVQVGLDTHRIERVEIKNGARIKSIYVITPKGNEYLETQTTEIGSDTRLSNRIISEVKTVEHGERSLVCHRRWTSDYIQRERIEMNDVFEEFIGILYRYTLTPLALSIIK